MRVSSVSLVRTVLPCLAAGCLPLVSRAQDFPALLDNAAGAFSVVQGVWRAGGAAVSHDGMDCLAGEAQPFQEAKLAADFTGPGTVGFWWKVAGAGPGDGMQILAEHAAGLLVTGPGGTMPRLTGNTGWERVELKLPAGKTRLTWTAQRGPAPVQGMVPGAFLDDFSWTPEGTAVPLGEALGSPGLSLTVTDAVAEGVQDSNGNSFAVLTPVAGDAVVARLTAVVPAGLAYVVSSGADARADTAERSKNFSAPAGRPVRVGTLFHFTAPGEVRLSAAAPGRQLLVDSVQTGLTAEWLVDAAPGSWQASGYYWPREDAGAVNGWYAQLEPVPFGYPGTDGKLERTVTEASRLRLRVRGGVTVSWNEVPVWTSSPASGGTALTVWTPVEWTSPGAGSFRLSGTGDVDEVQVEPVAPVTATEAMNAPPAVQWTLNSGWQPARDRGSYDGVASVRRTPGSLTGAAQAQWNGRGTVGWRVGPQGPSVLTARLDGVTVQQALPSARWRAFRAQVSAGPHVAEWHYLLNPPAPILYNAWLDSFSWQENAVPFSGAVDSPLEAWASEGDDTWSPATDDFHTGGSCLASPALPPGGESAVSLKVQGPATVKFRWRGRGSDVWAGTGPGTCRLNGATPWREEEYKVTASALVTLSWKIRSTGSAPVAAGAMLLDDVRVLPSSSSFTALDPALGVADNGLLLLQDGSAADTVTGGEAQDGVSSLRLAQGGVLRTEVTAPAEIRFFWKALPGGLTPQAGGFLSLTGGLTPDWKEAVVVLGGSGTRAFDWRANAPLLLDGITIRAAASTGTFSAGTGTVQGMDWGVASIGTDAAAGDAAVTFNGNPAARFGADWSGVFWKSLDTTTHRLLWQLRHDEPVLGGNLGSAPGVWQAGGSTAMALTGSIPPVTAYTGRHRWLAALSSSAAEVTPGELLGAPEWPWTVSHAAHWQSTAANTLRSTQQGAWLSTEFTGEGFFIATGVSGRLLVDGVPYLSPVSTVIPLSAGTHTVRLEQDTTSAATITLPRFVSEVPVPEALEESPRPGLTLISRGPGWTGIADRRYAPDGVDAALSPVLTGTPSVIRYSVTGPGWFRCRIRKIETGDINLNTGAFVMFPVSVDSIPATYFPAGTWEFELRARALGGVAPRVLLDQVDWQPEVSAPAPEAAAAMESGGLTWTTRAALPFVPLANAQAANAQAANGSFAAVPVMPTGEFSWMETTLDGPGTLLVDARNLLSSSEPAFTVETSQETRMQAITGGGKMVRLMGTGPQLVRILFRHGNAAQAGEGTPLRIALDRITWLPDSAPGLPPGAAPGSPALSFGAPAGVASPPWRVFDLPLWGGLSLLAADPGGNASVLPLTLSLPGFIYGTVSGNAGLADATGSTFYGPFDYNATRLMAPPRMASSMRATSLAFIQQVRFDPATPVALEEALDTPGRSWTTGGAAPWHPVLMPLATDDSAYSGAISSGQSAWLETEVTRPAVITWQGEVNGGSVEVRAGGVLLPDEAADATTYRHTLSGTGNVTVRWTVTVTSSNPVLERLLRIGTVKVESTVPPPLPEAANVSGFTLTTGTNAGVPWRVDAAAAFEGSTSLIVDAPPVPPVPASPASWIEGVLSGPGVFSFAYQSNTGVSLLVDGSEVGGQSTPMDGNWSLFAYVFPEAGTRTVRLTTTVSLTNITRVDSLRFDPLLPVSAFNQPGLSFTTSRPEWAVAGPPGKQVMFSYTPQYVETRLFADITGPGVFRSDFAGGDYSFAINNTYFTPGGTLFLPAGTHRLTWKSTSWTTLKGWSLTPLENEPLNVPQLLGAPELITRISSFHTYAAGITSPWTPGQPYLVTPWSAAPQVLQPAGTRLVWAQISASGTGTKWTHEAAAPAWFPRETVIRGGSLDTNLHLSALSVSPQPVLSRADALEDDSCLTWTVVQGWHPAAEPALSFDGEDAMIAGPTQEPAILEATVTGPLSIEFTRNDYMEIWVDGIRLLEASMGTLPISCRLDLGAGPHTIRWAAIISPQFAASEKAILDRFRCYPGAQATVLKAPVLATLAGGPLPARYLVTTPCLRNGTEFYAPAAQPLSLLPGEFTPLEPRPLAAILGVSTVSDGGWQGFGIPGRAGGVVWCPPLSSGQRILQFSTTSEGLLMLPRWLGLDGPGESWGLLSFNGEPVSSGSGPWAQLPAGQITVTAAQEAAFDTMTWHAYSPEQLYSTFASAAGLTGAAADPAADPDGDGRDNISEFAFGGNPTVPDGPTSDPVPVSVTRGGQQFAALEFQATSHGVHYILQKQTPDGWQAVPSQLEVLAETAPTRPMRLIYTGTPLPAPAPVILRIRAEVWPP